MFDNEEEYRIFDRAVCCGGFVVPLGCTGCARGSERTWRRDIAAIRRRHVTAVDGPKRWFTPEYVAAKCLTAKCLAAEHVATEFPAIIFGWLAAVAESPFVGRLFGEPAVDGGNLEAEWRFSPKCPAIFAVLTILAAAQYAAVISWWGFVGIGLG